VKEKVSGKEKILSIAGFIASLIVCVAVCLFPYVKNGIPGHIIDLIYSLERIEGLKDALKHGDVFASVYPRFFEGCGYGTPLFYSDVFFVPAAILRLIGLSPTQSFKLFMALIVSMSFTISYLCYKGISKDRVMGLLAAIVSTTSIYFIWEIVYRAGISSYIASSFIPVLAYAVWDFVNDKEKCGKKTFLFTIAFLGMVLSHIMTAVTALVITVIVFAVLSFIPRFRKIIWNFSSIKRLVSYAGLTVGLSAFYLFPMIEQMRSGHFCYENPLVYIGDFVVSFKSLFGLRAYTEEYNANIGLGVVLWIAAAATVCFSLWKKKIAAAFLSIIGIIISLSITDIFPWRIFNNTPVNSLQFSFRLFPFAICFIILGAVLAVSMQNRTVKAVSFAFMAFLSVVFAINENRGVVASELSLSFGEEFLDTEGTYYVGMGTEWLPIEVDTSSFANKEIKTVIGGSSNDDSSSDFEIPSGWQLCTAGYNRYSFEDSEGGMAKYTLPLVYYKGYKAYLTDEDGVKTSLPVHKSKKGLLSIDNPGQEAGIVNVVYKPTVVKIISVIISLICLYFSVWYPFKTFKASSNSSSAS